MKRLPVIPTIVVALAVAAMIAFGVWQLHRKAWKEELLVRYAANEQSAPISFPSAPNDDLLFRKTTGACAAPSRFSTEVGRSAAGTIGWRVIAHCSDGMVVQLGIARDPEYKAAWQGGTVSGFISHAPDHQPLIATLLGKGGPKQLMLVAETPPPGLEANAGPDLSAVPNNHLAYAVQWFLFALVALVIYALALRRRGRVLVTPPERG